MKFAKSIFTLLFLCIVSLTSCENTETIIDYPSCIDAKIDALKKVTVQNPPAEVWKWEVDHNVYYYITSDCCDQYNYLHNENCEIVCAPDGGFTGNGDGNCPEFNGEIVKTLIWKDER